MSRLCLRTSGTEGQKPHAGVGPPPGPAASAESRRHHKRERQQVEQSQVCSGSSRPSFPRRYDSSAVCLPPINPGSQYPEANLKPTDFIAACRNVAGRQRASEWEFIRAISFNLQGKVTEQAITFDQAHKQRTMSARRRSLICRLPQLQNFLLVCPGAHMRTLLWMCNALAGFDFPFLSVFLLTFAFKKLFRRLKSRTPKFKHRSAARKRAAAGSRRDAKYNSGIPRRLVRLKSSLLVTARA